jgi:hypothetical protein
MGKTARPTARTAAPVTEEAEVAEFPRALYKGNDKDPNGYDAKRAENASEANRLKRQGYKEADEYFGEPSAAEPASSDE